MDRTGGGGTQKFPTTPTLFSSNSSYPNFGIGGPMAGTTLVTILSSQFVSGFELTMSDSCLDKYLY